MNEAPRRIGFRQSSMRTIRHAPDSYGLVLVLVVLTVLVGLLTDSGDWLAVLSAFLVGATLTFALRTSLASKRAIFFARVTWVSVVVLAAIGVAIGPEKTPSLVLLMGACVLVITPFVILRRLVERREVTLETVLGAVSVYLIIGMIFAYLDAGYAALSGEAFFASGGSADNADYFYFAFITLTTVGYGDLSPVGNVPRLLAVFEALLGQLYLVTVISLVVATVGKQGLQRGKPHEDAGSADDTPDDAAP